MLTRIQELPVRSRALLSLAINAALALGWNSAAATAPQVINCNSSGTGSLAAAIADPMTVDGDTVDLTPLNHVCSEITVADLPIHQNDLILQGPGAKYLTIRAQSGRVLHHDGAGTLAISGVTLANGNYTGASKGKGGCVYSAGSISLIDAKVAHCAVLDTSDTALGGAVYAHDSLHLLRSTITDSTADGYGAYVSAAGGGAFAHDSFTALYSTVSNNVAGMSGNSGVGEGGGIASLGNVAIKNSTISSNAADVVGGALFFGDVAHTATVENSTVSGNTALAFAGMASNSPLLVNNSTVVFNRSLVAYTQGAGLYSKAPLTLSSSIVAGNSGADGANDLAGGPGAAVTGSDNLVFKSWLTLPMSNNATGVCPQLDVLADNGGPTLTHGLKPISTAIDKGSAAMTLTIDQRLEPRKTGPQVDIGAVEWNQADKLEGVLTNGFDGLCDH